MSTPNPALAAALAHSTVRRDMNEGNPFEAADALLEWDYVDGAPSEAIETRRRAERRLFMSP